MTPNELKAIRQRLGLSAAQFAHLLGYEGSNTRSMMHALESGLKTIREPQRRLADAYMDGYRPGDLPQQDVAKPIERVNAASEEELFKEKARKEQEWQEALLKRAKHLNITNEEEE